MQPLASPCKPRPAGDLRSAFAIWDLQRDSPRKLTPCLVIFDVTLKISYTLALQMRLKARSAICNLYLQAAEQSGDERRRHALYRSFWTLDEGARLNLMLNQYKVGGKGDEVMQFFQIPYGETDRDLSSKHLRSLPASTGASIAHVDSSHHFQQLSIHMRGSTASSLKACCLEGKGFCVGRISN